LALAVSPRGPFWTPSSRKFPKYSLGGVTLFNGTKLFDFAVVHSGSKLLTGGVSDDGMLGAASGVDGACNVRYSESRAAKFAVFATDNCC